MSDGKIDPGNNAALNDFHEKARRHTLPKWITDHLDQYEAAPEEGHLWDATPFGGHPRTPTLILVTRGRKSGRSLAMPLIYGKDGDRLVIVGSKGGAPEHPAWYLNLQAHPEVELQVARARFTAVGRTVEGDERARLFDMMTAIYPPFPSYQARTPREIPVVVLERMVPIDRAA
jgi:deazaflavin-dependent oxidoreductase (nitroreductase family)